MRHVWEVAKSITVCEEDEGPDENGDLPPPGHGGCGHRQPAVRREGLKLFGVYKRPEDSDSKKKVLVASPSFSSLSSFSFSFGFPRHPMSWLPYFLFKAYSL